MSADHPPTPLSLSAPEPPARGRRSEPAAPAPPVVRLAPAANGADGGPKSERTRQRILDAAARTFLDKGYAGTTLNDIAVASLLRAGSIYYHFDSKESLLEEVLDVGIVRVAAAVERAVGALPPDASPTERIRTGIEAHLRSLLYHGDYTSASFRIFGQAPRDVRSRVLSRRRAYADYWRRLLREARAVGEIAAERDLGLARMFLFGALNWSVEWYDPEKGALDDFVREAAETFLHGVLVPGSSGSADRGRMARPGSRAGTGPGPEGGASRTER